MFPVKDIIESVGHLGSVSGEAFASGISMNATVIDEEDREHFDNPKFYISNINC